MKDYNIQPASISDIPQLLILVNSSYRGELAKQGWTHEADLISGNQRIDYESMKILIENPLSTILKYENVSGDILGCVYIEKKGISLYLGMLSVSPLNQAKGIGKILMQVAEKYGIEHRCNSIEITVISKRKELIEWYKRRGFFDSGIRKQFTQDKRFGTPVETLEFIVMKKDI